MHNAHRITPDSTPETLGKHTIEASARLVCCPKQQSLTSSTHLYLNPPAFGGCSLSGINAHVTHDPSLTIRP